MQPRNPLSIFFEPPKEIKPERLKVDRSEERTRRP